MNILLALAFLLMAGFVPAVIAWAAIECSLGLRGSVADLKPYLRVIYRVSLIYSIFALSYLLVILTGAMAVIAISTLADALGWNG